MRPSLPGRRVFPDYGPVELIITGNARRANRRRECCCPPGPDLPHQGSFLSMNICTHEVQFNDIFNSGTVALICLVPLALARLQTVCSRLQIYIFDRICDGVHQRLSTANLVITICINPSSEFGTC